MIPRHQFPFHASSNLFTEELCLASRAGAIHFPGLDSCADSPWIHGQWWRQGVLLWSFSDVWTWIVWAALRIRSGGVFSIHPSARSIDPPTTGPGFLPHQEAYKSTRHVANELKHTGNYSTPY
jgi:hypothetical protein